MIFSLMPKGVEHTIPNLKPTSSVKMIFSLMPKGVEHIKKVLKYAPLKDDFFSDAERC